MGRVLNQFFQEGDEVFFLATLVDAAAKVQVGDFLLFPASMLRLPVEKLECRKTELSLNSFVLVRYKVIRIINSNTVSNLRHMVTLNF